MVSSEKRKKNTHTKTQAKLGWIGTKTWTVRSVSGVLPCHQTLGRWDFVVLMSTLNVCRCTDVYKSNLKTDLECVTCRCEKVLLKHTVTVGMISCRFITSYLIVSCFISEPANDRVRGYPRNVSTVKIMGWLLLFLLFLKQRKLGNSVLAE